MSPPSLADQLTATLETATQSLTLAAHIRASLAQFLPPEAPWRPTFHTAAQHHRISH